MIPYSGNVSLEESFVQTAEEPQKKIVLHLISFSSMASLIDARWHLLQTLGLLTQKEDHWDLEGKPPTGSSGTMPSRTTGIWKGSLPQEVAVQCRH